MAKRRWKARIGLVLLSLALLAVLNPEIRTALLIFDSIGLDLVLLLLSTQLRAITPFFAPGLSSLRAAASTLGAYGDRSILPVLLYMIAPRHAPAPLVLLTFLVAGCGLRLASGSNDAEVGGV